MKNVCAKVILFLLCLFTLAGCRQSREDMARQAFDEAVDAYMNKKYNKSKLLLDSVIYKYPDLKKIVKESKDMLEIINKTEQERNLNFLDSLLIQRENEMKPLLAQFEMEDPEAETPVYVHKKQNAQHAWERSYIRAHVDRNGAFYVSSHYTGNGYIHHYAVKAMVGNDFQQTDSVTGEGYTHSFSSDGNVWEVVKYKRGSDNGLAYFVASNFDRPVDVYFIGPKTSCRFKMTETDKQAFRDTYDLAMILKEIVQIKSQIRNVKMTMKRK